MGCQSPHRDKSPLSRVGLEKAAAGEFRGGFFAFALPRFALLERGFFVCATALRAA
jgi:hypothetical protein